MFTNMLKMSIKRFSHSPLLTHLTSNNLKVKISKEFLRRISPRTAAFRRGCPLGGLLLTTGYDPCSGILEWPGTWLSIDSASTSIAFGPFFLEGLNVLALSDNRAEGRSRLLANRRNDWRKDLALITKWVARVDAHVYFAFCGINARKSTPYHQNR